MHILYIYGAMLLTLIIGDLLWLGVIMKNFYASHLGHLMGPVQWAPAVLFYLIFTLGLLYFAVLPNLSRGFLMVIMNTALLGAFAYGVYDFTNHATLAKWPLIVTVVDIAWGAFLSGIIGSIAYGLYILIR